MKHFTWIFLLLFPISTLAQQSETLSVIVELETKITEKVRNIIKPVDPDAIIYTNVNIKKLDVDLTGTQMATLGFMATSDIKKIDDADIQSIEVTVLSSKPEFPKEVAKLVENVVLGVSKKGKVTVTKMQDSTFEAIQKNREYSKVQAENFQKIGKYAENFYQLLIWFGIAIIVGFAGVQILLSQLTRKTLTSTANDIVEKLAMINSNSASSEPVRAVAPALASPEQMALLPAPRKSELAPQNQVLDQLSQKTLLALISDAYWCEQDGYAAWLWAHLNPRMQSQLMSSWSQLSQYIRFLDSVPAVEEGFHYDSSYLSPAEIQHLSNQDLLEFLRTNPKAWGRISMMRRKAIPLGLKERVEFAKFANDQTQQAWPHSPSPLRELPQQIEISRLTEDDERSILENPSLVPENLRSRLPSLVWLYMCPVDVREQTLQSLPAQNLAEIWVGPEEVLIELESLLPEKKKALLKDYLSITKPNRSSPLLKQVTQQAVSTLAKLPVSDYNLKKSA
ncbi:MAG: hypothetical protein ACK5W9_05925 [Bdellovibrionales bacterium]